MIALSIVGGVILAFFIFMGTLVNKGADGGEEGAVDSKSVILLILIIALSGFLIAAGLFHSGWLFN